jgi:hypothetical protein
LLHLHPKRRTGCGAHVQTYKEEGDDAHQDAAAARPAAAGGGGGGLRRRRQGRRGGQPRRLGNAHGGKDISNDFRQALAFARCMRQHGLPNMPDPQLMGDGIAQRFPRGAGPNDPKVKAAQQACKQHLPNGGQVQRPSPQEQQEALAFARCMRQHGINMPDPQITAEGVLLDEQLPTGMRKDDPRLKSAERACEQRGGGGK